MVEPDGVHALEQFVLAKYFLTTQVIRHRIRLITDQMLIRGIILGIDVDEISDLKKIYAFDGTYDFVRQYASWGDSRFLNKFSADAFNGKLSHFLFRGLADRKLLKLVYRTPLKSLPVQTRQMLTDIGKPENQSIRRQIEQQIGEAVMRCAPASAAPGNDFGRFVILHTYTLKSVREQARNDESSVLINGSPPILFESASTLFQSIDEKLNETIVEIYAPVSYSTPAERRNLKKQLLTPITSILESISAGEE